MHTRLAVSIIVLLSLESSNGSHHHHLSNITCVNNGKEVSGRCVCEDGFVGMHCEKKVHCGSFERTPDGRCVKCEEGWKGAFCEVLQCVNGRNDFTEQKCICDQPYSGVRCESLKAEHVISFYNHRSVVYVPVGLLSVVPLLLILFQCRRQSETQRVKRVESSLNDQNIVADPRKLSTLLKRKKSETSDTV